MHAPHASLNALTIKALCRTDECYKSAVSVMIISLKPQSPRKNSQQTIANLLSHRSLYILRELCGSFSSAHLFSKMQIDLISSVNDHADMSGCILIAVFIQRHFAAEYPIDAHSVGNHDGDPHDRDCQHNLKRFSRRCSVINIQTVLCYRIRID